MIWLVETASSAERIGRIVSVMSLLLTSIVLINMPSYVFGDISSQLKKNYPEGSSVGYCHAFSAKVSGIKELEEREPYINYGELYDKTLGTEKNPVRPGDVIYEWTSGSTDEPNHSAIISKIFKDKNGKVWYELSETSGFKKFDKSRPDDRKVRHGRVIEADNPKIKRVFRGKIDYTKPEPQSSLPDGWMMDPVTRRFVKTSPQPSPSLPAGWSIDPVTKRFIKL